MDDLRFIASSLVSVVAAGGAVYGTFGGIELGAALKGRDGASQRDGALRLMAGIGITAIAVSIGHAFGVYGG